jgi:hypothetical protein
MPKLTEWKHLKTKYTVLNKRNVELGIFEDHLDAKRYAARLTKAGYDVRIEEKHYGHYTRHASDKNTGK